MRSQRLMTAISIAALVAQVVAAPALGAGSTIVKVNGTDLFCPFDTADAIGQVFAITRDRTDGEGFAFTDLFIEPTDPDAPVLVGGKDDPALTPTGFHDSWDMVDDATGEVIGMATVDATFTGTGEYRLRRVAQDSVQMGIFEDLVVSGSLTVATSGASYEFDLAGCDAGTQDRIDQAHFPNGPKPGGDAPANDAPAGAIALAVGADTRQWTGGASVDPEAPCVFGEGDDSFEFPLGRTVWFSVAGSGGPITIDPRGSDFDTVIAVYASTTGGLVQVACIDDDDIGQTQGLLTFDSTAGTTYLVQIGGVIGLLGGDPDYPQWGRLRLNVS
jgi:hypothetical protein